MALLARLTLRELSRRAVRAALKARVPEPAASAASNEQRLTVLGQVSERLTRIEIGNDRALGHVDVEILTRSACHVLPGAAAPSFRFEPPVHAKVDEGVNAFACNEENAASMTTIAAVGATARDVFLAPKTRAAIAAATGFDT